MALLSCLAPLEVFFRFFCIPRFLHAGARCVPTCFSTGWFHSAFPKTMGRGKRGATVTPSVRTHASPSTRVFRVTVTQLFRFVERGCREPAGSTQALLVASHSFREVFSFVTQRAMITESWRLSACSSIPHMCRNVHPLPRPSVHTHARVCEFGVSRVRVRPHFAAAFVSH